MRWFATHQDVEEQQRVVAELGSLVSPGDKARAVSGGCAVRIVASLVALFGFVMSLALGFALAEHAHWALAATAGFVGAMVSLIGSAGAANALMLSLYERAARNASSTPKLGSVSSGSSTAIPSIDARRGHE
jgi:hypothetical protein